MKIIKNEFNKLIKKLRNYISKLKDEHFFSNYYKNHVLFVIFVVMGVLNGAMLRCLCMHNLENYLSWKAIIADTVVVTSIGAFSFLFKPKNRFIYLISWSIFLTAICIINSIYYTFYTSFASISMLSLTQYIGDVGDAVVENVLQFKDVIYLIGPIVLLLVHLRLKKKNYYKLFDLKSERKKETLRSLSFAGILGVIFLLTMDPVDASRFIKQWNKESVVTKFGIYVYQANDVITSLQPKINSMFGL